MFKDGMEQNQTGIHPEVPICEALEKQLQDARKRLSEIENPEVKKKRVTSSSDGPPKPTKMGETMVESVVQTGAGAPQLEDGRFDGGVIVNLLKTNMKNPSMMSPRVFTWPLVRTWTSHTQTR
eukprot:2900510-Amphidinium_carterae.1